MMLCIGGEGLASFSSMVLCIGGGGLASLSPVTYSAARGALPFPDQGLVSVLLIGA